MPNFPPRLPRQGGFLCTSAILEVAKQLTQYPKQKRSSQFRRSIVTFAEVIDRVFFIFAGIATFWLGMLLFMAGLKVQIGYWVYFIIFWAVVAYLALPRLHRILSQIYVPNYFIGRTRTSDGLLGDPVNIAFRGSEAQLHAAMEAAGWHLAEDITAKSTWRIVTSTLRRQSYSTAPVSPLHLFGRQQDFSYQQEVDGSPLKRHHIRFWHCPSGWLLPGGHDVDWLAAGTFDTSVGVSFFTFQITHRIDENTDIERDYIVDSLKKANSKARVTVIKDFSTGYHARNGGGDTIITDGDLPIVELGKIAAKEQDQPDRAGLILDSTFYEPDHEHLTPASELAAALWSKRPLQLVIGAALIALIMIMELFQASTSIYNDLNQVSQMGGSMADIKQAIEVFSLLGFVFIAIEIVLIVYVLRGSNIARLLLLVLAAAVIVQKGVEFFVDKQPITFGNSLIYVSLHIGILLALSSDAARRFVYSVATRNRLKNN